MAYTDEDPSVRMPLPDQMARPGRYGEHPEEDRAVSIPIDDVNLKAGVSCVDQFKEFFATHDMNHAIRILQDDREINVEDPYIAYLLEDKSRIAVEMDKLRSYLRINGALLMIMHEPILTNFMIFLQRLYVHADVANPEPRVVIHLDRLP